MILDTAHVATSDWRRKQAIEIQPGAELASPMSKPTVITDRTIRTERKVICLLLSNGRTLSGSPDQNVKTYRSLFREMKDLKIGDRLAGNVEGMPTIVHVTGIMWLDEKESRLVELATHEKRPYIVEEIVCR